MACLPGTALTKFVGARILRMLVYTLVLLMISVKMRRLFSCRGMSRSSWKTQSRHAQMRSAWLLLGR